jgi:hypothetical protein
MSTPFPLSLPPGPAEDGTSALVPVPEATSSLAIQPEVALAAVTETLALATSAMDAKWEREREKLFRRHVALLETRPQELAKISGRVEAVFRTTAGFCNGCGATLTRGAVCSQKCATKVAEAANARMARVQAELDKNLDRESAALERAARAEVHEGEVLALQRLDRATLKAALNDCHEEYRAAVEQCDANDRYALKLFNGGVRGILGERNRRVLTAQRTARRIEEALARVLQHERDERVGRVGGAPPRHCQVCLMSVIEFSPWCSKQCQRVDEAGKTYVASYVPGLFRCEWCRRYFWVPDPDRANIHEAAAFCSRACLNALPVDLDEHADMDFSTVRILPPPPPTIAGRQRAFAGYIQRFIEHQDRHQPDQSSLAASRPIEITAPRKVLQLPAPPALAVVKALLTERLGSRPSLVVRPAELVGDLGRRLGSKPNAETVGGWLRGLGAQRLPKDRRGARYQVSQDHLRS